MDKKIISSPLRKYLKQSIYGVLFFAISIAAYSFSQSSGEGRSHNLAINTLTISTVTQGIFVDALSLRGQVVPKTTIYLDTTAGGRVEQRLVEQGEFVKKGQPLVLLSNTNLQLDVMGREAQVTEQLNFLRNTQMNMATSRLDLRRDLLEVELQISHLKRRSKQSSTLVNQGLLAKDQLAIINDDLSYYEARKVLTIERQNQENSIRKVQVLQLEESAIMLEKNLQFARNNLDNLLIKAPVSGYLSEFTVEIGESKNVAPALDKLIFPMNIN